MILISSFMVAMFAAVFISLGMAWIGFPQATNKVYIGGSDELKQRLKIETATNCNPGRLVTKGTNDDDLIVGTAITPPLGWLDYETANYEHKPASLTTAYEAADEPWVLHGPRRLFITDGLAAGFSVQKGDLLCNWAAGQMAGPCMPMGEGMALSIPFSNSAAAEADTGVDLPALMVVKDCIIEVTTAVGGSSISVGLLSTEGGGDANGFVAAHVTTAAGFFKPGCTVTTGSNEVYLAACFRGAMLVDTFTAGSDAVEDVGTYFEINHLCDGTATSVSYTTSNHAVVGNIILLLWHPNLQIVARAEETVDATAAEEDINITSLI